MSSLPPRLVRALIIGAVLAIPLAACGRKGPLEPPPGAANAKPDPLAEKSSDDPETALPGRTIAPTITPVRGRDSRGSGSPITAPKESFVLDPIL